MVILMNKCLFSLLFKFLNGFLYVCFLSVLECNDECLGEFVGELSAQPGYLVVVC